MTLSYYVYYRVPQQNAERAHAAVEAIQRELSAASGVAGRLLRRHDDASTWMEIYENVNEGPDFEARLAQLVERYGFTALLAPGSSRKQEVFRDL